MSRQLQQQKLSKTSQELPPLPEKIYFTIGEASKLCLLQPHVLRYWEQEFPQLRPAKRRGNRRYYQKVDILLVRHIRELLYEEGFTIEGAKAKLYAEVNANKTVNKVNNVHNSLQEIAKELENILTDLKEQDLLV
jgi:DNA-binding transcriptional MerR regulator